MNLFLFFNLVYKSGYWSLIELVVIDEIVTTTKYFKKT